MERMSVDQTVTVSFHRRLVSACLCHLCAGHPHLKCSCWREETRGPYRADSNSASTGNIQYGSFQSSEAPAGQKHDVIPKF